MKRLITFVTHLLLSAVVLAQPVDTTPMQTIGNFSIDVHEVTIEQVTRFARATGFVSQAERSGGGSTFEGGWVQRAGWNWRTPFGTVANPNEPAVHLTYDEAAAYCAWAGKRLPSDAEWIEAAYTERRASPPSGLTSGNTYPYPTGNSAVGANCLKDCGPIKGDKPYAQPRFTSIGSGHVQVRTTPPGINGLYDMGGNVWEWTQGGNAEARPTRGGSWWYGAAQMHRDHLQTKPANTAVVYIGFRCAKAQR
ncbi:MAG: formylglycine-generating enzyme family protein [Burkholderiales bacterium]|nr:MAG: formylglycine-generating enzyme family protein [Betaproteobacteria bacterium]TAG24889.1 MAG: formylglycine-generating enzyme family protein [Burkholderiales bacterium]